MSDIKLTTELPRAADRPINNALFQLASLAPDDPTRKKLRNQVIADLTPIAAQVARRFRNRGESFDDLKQVATVALINAVDRFDPQAGDFFPYAVTLMTGEIKRHLRDRIYLVKPPRRIQELIVEIVWAESSLSQELRRAPTPAEIASCVGATVEDVEEAISARRTRRAVSFYTPILQAVSDVTVLDIIGGDDPRLDEVEIWLSLRPLIAALPSRTRRILQLRFGDDMTQTEIAELIGISQMHVSRILSVTMQQMRTALKGFEEIPAGERARRRRKAKYQKVGER